MQRNHLRAWDLRNTITELVTRAGSIEAVYLFGSRARRTNSYRSDIDLLIYTPQGLAAVDFGQWVNDAHNPVDLFETNDHRNARSLINGSAIFAAEGTVESKLDAVMLWSNADGFSEDFDGWIQQTLLGANFAMTILPVPGEITSTARRFAVELMEAHLPNTTLGSGWREIASGIAQVVAAALDTRFRLRTDAKNIRPHAMKIQTEYDFQNLIHLVLKPWLPTLAPEPFVIEFDGQKKNADFAIEGNGLVIEAKHIRDAGTKAAVLKTLDGLQRFYGVNPNVRALLFLILVDDTVDFDKYLIQNEFGRPDHDPPTVVCVLSNAQA